MMHVFSKRDLSGLGDDDTFSTDSGTGINTSGVSVGTPTSAQTDNTLNALAQTSCASSGGLWDPITKSCSGSGGSATCPTGYVLNGIACQLPSNPAVTVPVVGVAATAGNNYLLYAALGIGLLALIKAGK